MSSCVAGARDCAPVTHRKTWGFCSSFNYNHHYTPLHSSTFHYTALQLQLQPQLQLQQHYITLHYSTLHVTTLHSTRLRSTTLHYTNYNYTYTYPYTTLHYTTVHYTNNITLHDTTRSKITQLQPPFSPSVDSLCHPWFATTNLSYRFPIFETSATTLCGTTGIC